MKGETMPVLEDVVDMDLGLEDDDERRWLVLYDEDYDDLLIDGEDSVALLLDSKQAGEVLQLASVLVGDLAAEDAPEKEPIDAIIDRLQEVSGRDE